MVKAGDVVSVRVKEVDADRKRIALSMKREASGTQGAHGAPQKSQGKDRPGKCSLADLFWRDRPSSDDANNPFAALKNLKLN